MRLGLISRGREGLPLDNEDNTDFSANLIWNCALITGGARKREGKFALNIKSSESWTDASNKKTITPY
jgi:hypothetical protein